MGAVDQAVQTSSLADDGRVLLVEHRIDPSSGRAGAPVIEDVDFDLDAVPWVGVDTSTEDGIDGFLAALAEVVEAKRTQWAYAIPASWRAVRTELAAWRDPLAHGRDARPLERVTEAQLLELCRAHDVADPFVALDCYLCPVRVLFRVDADSWMLDPPERDADEE